MAICYDIRYLQPGDLNVYWRGDGETERRLLTDECLLRAIPIEFGDVVVVNDGR